MLRDLKFLRRTSGKNSNLEEVENVPSNPRESLGPQNVTDSSSSRVPFSTIQEPFHDLKGGIDQDAAVKAGKNDRTPIKPKSKATVPLKTPERQPKYRFGWAQKGDSYSNAMEAKDEGRSDVRAMVNTNTPRSTRTDGRRANSGYSECHSTQSTPTKSVSKPPYSAQYLTSGSRPPSSAGDRVSNFAALAKGIPISSNSCTVVNTIEVPHFELKEDPSFWMEHSVQVLIRVRPLNNAEKSTYGYSRCLKQESAQCISWIGQPETRFTFDHVACETIDQETLFRMVGLPMVENCLSGYNSCMFAYGQTGSGKTHTMLGDIEDLEIKPSSNRGMTPRIFEFLFARIRAEEDSRKDENLQYHCKCSFLEIYNEQITDLLDPSSTNLMLREDMKNGVYVENLSEFDVQTVADVLKLVRLGSSNRKVAATNMNRESSRSHSVFTCVIESVWEKDSASSFRFARLNLVDLAGSERQKTSGAEGDRLKEATSINKSLSTLGHVIMVLVDVANGRPRHVPYRDSRLTFLLQDSLGGNSKTMIIANVSPSVCSAAETLNTLKFAQRAKLIQNNAIVNEDSSGDVTALKSQIQLLKEELSLLKRQNVSRALSFGQSTIPGTGHQDEQRCPEEAFESKDCAYTEGKQCEGTLRLSTRQMRSLETTLAGALRREKMAETSIRQLEAEIEQLNRLVHQREEDTRCTKMMLKFREDKIQRMESLLGGLIPSDAYLVEENNALTTEVQLLHAKIEKNPEVTRFALENIRLLEQLRRFQDFYEEGEREILLAEVSELRDQILRFLDGNLKQLTHSDVKSSPEVTNVTKENESLKLELKRSLDELEECRSKLSSCIEYNAKHEREIEELRAYLAGTCSLTSDHASTAEVIKEPISEAPYLHNQAVAAEARYVNNQTISATMVERQDSRNITKKHSEEILNLQLEMDILKIILSEQRSCLSEVEKSAKSLSIKLDLSNEEVLSLTEQCEAVQKELDEAKSVIDALESQQILAINEIEDLKNSNTRFAELLHQQELELSSSRKETCLQESRKLQPKDTEHMDSPLHEKLNKMHKSLDKAKRLNQRYQNDQVFQESNEEEMDEVRRQVEGETAEVIVCLQEELANLQHEVLATNSKEMETSKRLELSQAEVKMMEEKLFTVNQENMKLSEMLQNKEQEVKMISEEWEMLTSEVEAVLMDGHESLADASDQLDIISRDFLPKRSWISEQVGRMRKSVLEKDLLIEELNQCLEDAFEKKNEMECMWRSLKGAAVVMAEAHQEQCKEKDNKIILLKSQLSAEASVVLNLKNKVKNRENQLKEITTCTMATIVVLSRFSESNAKYLGELESLAAKLAENEEQNMKRSIIMQHQVSVADEAEKQIQSLKRDIEALRMQLGEAQMHTNVLRQQIEEHEEADILRTGEKLTELKSGVSEVKSCIKDYSQGIGSSEANHSNESSAYYPTGEVAETRTGSERRETSSSMNSPQCPSDIEEKSGEHREYQNDSSCLTSKGAHRREATITLLKKEIESALESLKGVQAEMTKLHSEKEIISRSEKESKKSIGSLASQTLALENSMDHFEGELKRRMEALDVKLKGFEEFARCSCTSWFQKELIEAELADAKVVAVQKATEAACILAKFEEVQDTLKEADVMINQLVIANEALKLDLKKMKDNELLSVNSSNILIEKVKSLESINDLKDRNYGELEKQVKSDIMTMDYFAEEMKIIISQVKDTYKEECMSLASDCKAIKSQVDGAMKLIKSSLEDIWSEIIMRDSAVSVLHLCHIGVLLETVTGLNAENSFLHHGVDKSNAIISELREHNFRSKRDLERCRILEGKLLADIKNSFDRISRQEDETGEFCVKLNTFHQKILDLQLQEEQMLQRSNSMGSELAALMTELDLSDKNVLASLLDQERLMREKEELFKTREENFVMELSARDFELFIMSCKLNELVPIKANLENTYEVVEIFKREIILWSIDARSKESILVGNQLELSLLQNHLEETELERMALLIELDIRNIFITQMDESHKTLLLDLQASKETDMNDLKINLCESKKAKQDLSSQVAKFHAEYGKPLEEKKEMEAVLELSSSQMSAFEQQNEGLQNSISQLQNEQGLEFSKLSCLEEENAVMLHEIGEVKKEHCLLSQDLEDKKTELEASLRRIDNLVIENQSLQANLCVLKEQSANVHSDLHRIKAELNEVQLSESMIKDHLELKQQDLKIQVDIVKSLQEENASLRNELTQNLQKKGESLNALSLNVMKCVNSVEHMQSVGSKILNFRSEESKLADNLFSEVCIEFERMAQFMDDIEHMGKLAKELVSDTATLQTELFRKDELLNGLLFDMRLLQESASTSKDQKDEKESLMASMRVLEEELKSKSASFREAVTKSQKLEAELHEKMHMVSALEFDVAKEHETVKSLSCKSVELIESKRKVEEAKEAIEEELTDRRLVNESLEKEITEMGITLDEMSCTVEMLKSNLNNVTSERDDLLGKVHTLKKELEIERAKAEENGMLLAEAREEAAAAKLEVEHKEEEVKLLDRCIEELECTVNVLENKVDILKEEAERQQLQREELETELEAVKEQMQSVKICDDDMKRKLMDKEKTLRESLQRVEILEREVAERDEEIARRKLHISEVTLHADAQASEYKQKFKALEAMVEQLKQDIPATHGSNSSANKLEKNASKSRGSGSPFKCIGLGLVQQIKSEKEEERHRIEELEVLANNRQKEIFMLNARLATAESMTHDVIRDLLGLKLDMNNCATMLDTRELQTLTEKAEHKAVEARFKEEELDILKQQLNAFTVERKGWLDEIDRKQAELVAAQVALEKLRQREHLLQAENEMFKVENVNHKKRVMELEAEVRKLSGQQNIQQRIHHHAKIKEENNLLKNQNAELGVKLQRTDAYLTRVKEELAKYRMAAGISPCINLDEEERLSNELKETEAERLQLAHKLVGLCTSILKAAGITRPGTEVNPAAAEEAIEHLKRRINTLETELQDVKLKNRMNKERIRLTELMPLENETPQNSLTSRRSRPQTPYLSALDR